MRGEEGFELISGAGKLDRAGAVEGPNYRPLTKLERRLAGIAPRHPEVAAALELPQRAVAVDAVRQHHDRLAGREIFRVESIAEEGRYVDRGRPEARGEIRQHRCD